MRIEGDTVVLSSGREFYANHGILGISYSEDHEDVYDDPFAISEGYDGGVSEKFTREERREMADYMMALWDAWGDREVVERPEPVYKKKTDLRVLQRRDGKWIVARPVRIVEGASLLKELGRFDTQEEAYAYCELEGTYDLRVGLLETKDAG